jgi:hypothetical protein
MAASYTGTAGSSDRTTARIDGASRDGAERDDFTVSTRKESVTCGCGRYICGRAGSSRR